MFHSSQILKTKLVSQLKRKAVVQDKVEYLALKHLCAMYFFHSSIHVTNFVNLVYPCFWSCSHPRIWLIQSKLTQIEFKMSIPNVFPLGAPMTSWLFPHPMQGMPVSIRLGHIAQHWAPLHCFAYLLCCHVPGWLSLVPYLLHRCFCTCFSSHVHRGCDQWRCAPACILSMAVCGRSEMCGGCDWGVSVQDMAWPCASFVQALCKVWLGFVQAVSVSPVQFSQLSNRTSLFLELMWKGPHGF